MSVTGSIRKGAIVGRQRQRSAPSPLGHLSIRAPAIAPAVSRTRHLLDPVEDVNTAKIVEVGT